MEYKICLSKKLLIFYGLLSMPIMYGSINNLINLINGTGSVLIFGGFSLFGFILFPILLISSYRHNICTIKGNDIKIGLHELSFTNYNFKIVDYIIPLGDRPIVSLHKKTYHKLIVKKKNTNLNYLEKDLDIFSTDIAKLRVALAKNLIE